MVEIATSRANRMRYRQLFTLKLHNNTIRSSWPTCLLFLSAPTKVPPQIFPFQPGYCGEDKRHRGTRN